MNILGVCVSHTLTFHHHIFALVKKVLIPFMSFIRAHGINGSTLWDVTRASLVAQLLYASPAWWGYLKVSG